MEIFPQTVHCWGTQFYLKVCPPCVRGCVRLRTICLPIHLSPNSFVSQVLCQGLCPPPGDLSPNSFVSQFICLPGPVSGAVSASGGSVSQFICPPCVRGCVRLRTICLPIHLYPNSFVSQVLVSQFICLPGPVAGAVSASGGLVAQFICLPIHLSPRSCVRGCVRLRGICLPIRLSSIIPQTAYCWGTQFYLKMCPPCVRGCVRLPGLCVSHQSPNSLLLAFSILFQAVSGYVQMVVSGSPDVPNSFVPLWQFICLPIWLVVSSSLAVSNSFNCPYINSFVSQSGWWCPALRLSLIHLSPLVATHLSPNLAGGVRLWLSPIHLSCLVATHLSPSLAGGVRLFGCLSHAGDVRLFGCL